jgi:hypothetical protein
LLRIKPRFSNMWPVTLIHTHLCYHQLRDQGMLPNLKSRSSGRTPASHSAGQGITSRSWDLPSWFSSASLSKCWNSTSIQRTDTFSTPSKFHYSMV